MTYKATLNAYLDRIISAETEAEADTATLALCYYVEMFNAGAEVKAKVQRIKNAIG